MCPGEYVKIAVSDTGTGISIEHLPHIFEPFFSTKEPGIGTGLGLAQVYGIVKQHDGYIGVNSKLGHGTTFTIYFPVAELLSTGPLVDKNAPMVKGGQETILLVEDDEAVGDALTDTLTMYGYKVLLTKNGQEALAVYNQQAEEIALVISDVVMPVMGGQELNKALREKDPNIKMLVITGYSWDWCEKKFYEQGGIAWLEKPFSDRQLLTAIRSALDE
jgi:CheY-like chemotaxis protein